MWLQTDCTSQKQHIRKNVLHTSLYFQCFKILVLLLDRLYRLHYHPSAREMERCQRIQDFILICIRHAGKDILINILTIRFSLILVFSNAIFIHNCLSLKRYVSASTGLASVILFLPCVFKEFSTQETGKSNGNAEDDTTETLNIAEAEAMKGKDSAKPHIDKKG